MMISMYSKYKKPIYTILSMILIIFVWHITALGLGKPYMIPTPKAVFIKMPEILLDKNFIKIVTGTLIRVFISFIVSFVLAIIVGLIAGISDTIEYILNPVIIIIRSTPTMALITLALIWFKGDWSAIFLGFQIIFPIIYSNVLYGIKIVDKKLLVMARTYRVKSTTIIKDIYIPSIRNYVLAGIDSAIGLNFKVIIAAEFLGDIKYSMGRQLYIQKMNLEMDGVIVWCLLLISTVVLLEAVVTKVCLKFDKNYR